MTELLTYRDNVGAILLRPTDRRLLMAERINMPGTWQFPQGGVDPGETHEEAMWREVAEELGLRQPRDTCDLLGVGPAVCYEFPATLTTPITRHYRGQRQTLYLLAFHGRDDDFDLAAHHDPEFSAIQWVTPQRSLELMWAFKRPILEQTYAALSHLLGC